MTAGRRWARESNLRAIRAFLGPRPGTIAPAGAISPGWSVMRSWARSSALSLNRVLVRAITFWTSTEEFGDPILFLVTQRPHSFFQCGMSSRSQRSVNELIHFLAIEPVCQMENSLDSWRIGKAPSVVTEVQSFPSNMIRQLKETDPLFLSQSEEQLLFFGLDDGPQKFASCWRSQLAEVFAFGFVQIPFP